MLFISDIAHKNLIGYIANYLKNFYMLTYKVILASRTTFLLGTIQRNNISKFEITRFDCTLNVIFTAGYNNVEVAEFLLENGADVNAQDKGGLIPLHNASSYGVSDTKTFCI